LRDLLYFNTFSVAEYIHALEEGRSPIALSLELSEAMQMAGWLYWRIYETRFRKGLFRRRFVRELDLVYGATMRALGCLGLLRATPDEIILSDRGAFWLHALQDLFSIGYISKLWGVSRNEPWPERVEL
jgi:oxygen-independent coproporphyrinogen-3 oxidase